MGMDMREERLALEKRITELQAELRQLKQEREEYYHIHRIGDFDNSAFDADRVGLTPIDYVFDYPTQKMRGWCGYAVFSVPKDVMPDFSEFIDTVHNLCDEDYEFDLVDDVIKKM